MRARFILTILVLPACRGPARQEQAVSTPSRSASVSRPRPNAAPAAPPAMRLPTETRLLMAQLEDVIGELGRRIGHGGSEGPARVLRTLAARLPELPGPDAARWRLAIQAKARTLGATPTKAAVDALLGDCISCHRLHAPHSLGRLEALRVRP